MVVICQGITFVAIFQSIGFLSVMVQGCHVSEKRFVFCQVIGSVVFCQGIAMSSLRSKGLSYVRLLKLSSVRV